MAGGAQSPPAQQSQPVPRQMLQNLPLQMDSVIAASTTTHQLVKRHLGENFDQRLNFTHNHFVSTADNKNILACGFWDNSFRAFSTDSGINYWNDLKTRPTRLYFTFCDRVPLALHIQYVAYELLYRVQYIELCTTSNTKQYTVHAFNLYPVDPQIGY